MEPEVAGVSISHPRLVELYKLADAAEPYYLWLQEVALALSPKSADLDDFLMHATVAEVQSFAVACRARCEDTSVPQVFDGIGRPYRPRKALYYFLGWMVRDAPQQRLQPLLTQAVRTGLDGSTVEAAAFAQLVVAYREVLQSFRWTSVREVVADRLEGSRRSLRGRAVEAAVRTVVADCLADERKSSGRYGRFEGAVVSEGEVLIDGHAFDVCIDFMYGGDLAERVVLPVKSRETQGGGHANLFTRDIEAAMTSLRRYSEEQEVPAWMAPVIVAENWHGDQVETVRRIADDVVLVSGNPNAMEALPSAAAEQLRGFLGRVMAGDGEPK